MKTFLFILIAVGGFVLGAWFLSPSPVPIGEVTASGRNAPIESGNDLPGHIASAAFFLLAAWLLIKNVNASKRNRNDMVMMFSIGILTTIFGRYVGPVALPEFLQLPR